MTPMAANHPCAQRWASDTGRENIGYKPIKILRMVITEFWMNRKKLASFTDPFVLDDSFHVNLIG